MVDSLRDRENEILTYLRNNLTDPSSRGTATSDTFSGNAVLTAFTLTNTTVKNVTSVTVDGDTKYIGHDYTVVYGEGSDSTVVTFTVAPSNDTDNIVIAYRYGASMIYEGFQRLDATLPRVSIIFGGATPEFVSIGEDTDGTGKWIYYDSTYVAEIRSRYAKQMKTVMNDFANVINRYRQKTPQPYKTVVCQVTFLQSFDFDNELRIYRAQVGYKLRWFVRFQDS